MADNSYIYVTRGLMYPSGLTSKELLLFQSARERSKAFSRFKPSVQLDLSGNVVALVRCASEHFGMPELNKRSNPLFKQLKSKGIHYRGQQYLFSRHNDPKRIEVLTNDAFAENQSHFEIVLSTVRVAQLNPQSGLLGPAKEKTVLTVNVLSSQ